MTADAESLDPSRPLLDPTAPAPPGNTAEQLGAYLADRVLAGLSAGLAASMAKRTFENGPWLLMGDGRLFRVDTPDPPYGVLLELLADHTSDYGRCDHPHDCACSDGQARRLLASKQPGVRWLDSNPLDLTASEPTVTVAELVALLDACTDGDGCNGGDLVDALTEFVRQRHGLAESGDQ